MYHIEKFEKSLFVKSGTDFQNLSEIIFHRGTLEELKNHKNSQSPVLHGEVTTGERHVYKLRDDIMVTVVKHDITKDTPVDEEIAAHVEKFDMKLKESMKRVAC